MLIDIVHFNRVRNDFKLDMKLEVNMLKEEIQEFFDANTLAERVDAVTDVSYVFEGTKIKCAYNGFLVDENVNKWVTDSVEMMLEILTHEVGSEGKLAQILVKAQEIVAEINALKVSELDENGKVKKQHDLPNATVEISKMLEKDFGIEREVLL